ncbi:glycosyltransferase family 4 protein [Georgenia yuyongxinii]
MKHVLVLNQYALPRDQGGGTRHIDLFGRLTGWKAIIVAGDHNHYTMRRFATADPRFRLLAVPPYNGNGLARILGLLVFAARALAVALRMPRVDLIYASTPQLLVPAIGLIAARMRRLPFVLEVRDLWPESIVDSGAISDGGAVHRVLAALERVLVRSADWIVAVAPGWDDHFAGLGADASRMTIIPNGTEPDDFDVMTPRDELRERHGITGFTAVYAGAHGPKNGLEYVLSACEELPDVNFVLLGDGNLKEDLKRRAAELGLANIEFRDQVTKRELPEVLAACDVGIHCVTPFAVFEKGMSPNKLFDYIAAGLPVVSNARNALRATLRDDEIGPLGEPDDLAAGLRRVRDAAPDSRRRWVDAGRELLATRYSRSAAARELEAVLDGWAR